MNVTDEIINQMAARIAKEIDTEIIMTATGWHSLEIGEGRVYGSRYLTVHPSNGHTWNDMMDWCVETFGPSSHDGVWTPNMRWYSNNAKFWFRSEKDLAWFMLKWS